MSSSAGPPAPRPHPDYRFSLANERTLLAWLRTALALVAGGVAMTQFAPELGLPGGGAVVSVVLLLGGLLARGAAVHGRPALVVPAGVVALAGLAVLGVLTPYRRRGSQRAAADGTGSAPRAAAAVTALVVLAALCGLASQLLHA